MAPYRLRRGGRSLGTPATSKRRVFTPGIARGRHRHTDDGDPFACEDPRRRTAWKSTASRRRSRGDSPAATCRRSSSLARLCYVSRDHVLSRQRGSRGLDRRRLLLASRASPDADERPIHARVPSVSTHVVLCGRGSAVGAFKRLDDRRICQHGAFRPDFQCPRPTQCRMHGGRRCRPGVPLHPHESVGKALDPSFRW